MSNSSKAWTVDDILGLARTYQGAAVICAAADLEIFDQIHPPGVSAEHLATKLHCDQRRMHVLLDALTALGLLNKSANAGYELAPGVSDYVSATSSRSVLAMLQHQANCMRRWAQLAWTVKEGRHAPELASIRGERADEEAFINAMHNVSAPVAPEVIQGIRTLDFRHLLDVGGASGTWTIAFLKARTGTTATLFDRPHVIPMAERRLEQEGLAGRVQLVPGDYNQDVFPPGADLVWVSAIVHQNSRVQNRALFASIFRALCPGGRIAIRDILMDSSRTTPLAGALFAVNMLVGTEAGGTFTFEELREDLEAAGFRAAHVTRPSDDMNAIVVAQKPAD